MTPDQPGYFYPQANSSYYQSGISSYLGSGFRSKGMEAANQEELKLWGGKRVGNLNKLTHRQLLQAIKGTKEEIRNRERPAVFDGVLCGCFSCCAISATQYICGIPVPGAGACGTGLIAGAVCGVTEGLRASVEHNSSSYTQTLRRLNRHCRILEDHLEARKTYLDRKLGRESRLWAVTNSISDGRIIIPPLSRGGVTLPSRAAAAARVDEYQLKRDFYWRQCRALEYGLESDTYNDAMDIVPIEGDSSSDFDTSSEDEALQPIVGQNNDDAPILDQPQAQGLRRRRI